MYNGLQISAQRRFASGFQFDIAYTFSRARDDASSLTDIIRNAYSDKGYYGISDLDRTHVFIASYIYELPFRGTGNLAKRLLGNFPQAFSHIGLINTARNLIDHQGPAEKRKRGNKDGS